MTDHEPTTTERRFLGVVEVDSGTLVIGDPAYMLPRKSLGKEGIDYQAVIEVDATVRASELDGRPVLLIQDFGGDGAYAVYGEFEDGEFMRLCVSLNPIDVGEDDDEE